MGNINSLFTTNPSEIWPVEAYLSNSSCDSIENLGSTRFMKVAKGKTAEGVFVYKIYVRPDTASLDPYPMKIIEIRKALVRAPNCCPIKRILVKQKYAVMTRIYQKFTLFERLDTRPFVVYPEKVWYIFQLFKALSQCEAAKVCHGDLKSQNVLISSSNWLQITDFAPFKPSFLPQDNPSSFTFFFDTSRRQSCYIAPERFLSSNEYDVSFAEGKETWLFDSLKPAMDIFSAGCIVYELLCDGRVPFTYSQLCEYHSCSNSEAAITLARLVNDVPTPFRPLLKMLLNREPALRLSANAVLSGAAFSFPPILEQFLFRYLDVFRPIYGCSTNQPQGLTSESLSQPLEFAYIEPDDVISKLKREKNIWWTRLTEKKENHQFSVLFVSLITANLRSLKTIQSKTDAMNLLVELSSLCESSVPIERVLPYFVNFMNDPETQIRSTAVSLSADLLAPVHPKTYDECLVLVDYLFPEISSLMTDDCPQHVLFSIATSLGSLASTAYRFLLVGREIQSGSYDDDISVAENIATTDSQPNSDDTTALLHGISAIFSSLCSRDPMVKKCLVEPQSFVKLFEFFTKIGNGDNLLTFLITFLNAKTEWRLRAAFFDSLPICVQKQSVGMVPLIQQGLQDYEEHVVVRALGCVQVLIRNKHLDRVSIKELLPDVLSFLVHPNEWIRSAVCDILIEIDSTWNMADVYVKVIPQVEPFIEETKRKTISLKSKPVLLCSLIDPIPKKVFNQITELSLENTKKMVALLEIHYENGKPFEAGAQWFNSIFPKIDTSRSNNTQSESSSDRNILTAALKNRSRLLTAVFAMRKMFLRMADTRNTAGMEQYLTRQVGIIDLSSNNYNNVRRKEFIYGLSGMENTKMVINCPMSNERKETLLVDGEVAFEEERTLASGPQNLRSSIFDNHVSSVLAHLNDLHSKNVCSRQIALVKSAAFVNCGGTGSGKPQTAVRGTIISHLHEHLRRINKLCASKDGEMFASCSDDGSVKIWKTKTVIGEGYGAARSEDTWYPSEGKREDVKSVGWCDQFVCAASQDGFVRWADVLNGSTKVITSVQISQNEGAPVYMHTNGPICFIRTHHGVLYGLDLRVGASNGPLGRHDVWRKKLRDDHGLITCSAIDPWQQSWMVFGSNSNKDNLMLYDLRFREEVLRWGSPHKDLRPIGVWANPVSKIDGPEVYVGYDMHGEVSSFELGVVPTRKRVLWTGGSPILTYNKNESRRSEYTQLKTKALCVCEATGLVYTGDSKGAIRKWNVSRASGCEVLSSPPKGRTTYRTIFEEASESENDPFVVYERSIVDTDAKENRRIVPLDSKPSTYHRTPITDMMLLSPELMVSAAYDGVVKIWK